MNRISERKVEARDYRDHGPDGFRRPDRTLDAVQNVAARRERFTQGAGGASVTFAVQMIDGGYAVRARHNSSGREWVHDHRFDDRRDAIRLLKAVKGKFFPADHFEKSPHWILK